MKRTFDLILTLGSAPFWVPLLFILGFLVRIKLGSPVFFKQERPGLGGKPFVLIKFRTMTDARDDQGNLLPDAVRLTEIGKWLRSTSLDEFPEFINVLKGEMSLVGPRPLLMEYLPLYSDRQAKRHDVSPGVTGWSQVNGRNALSWPEKLELDVWYVENGSLILDIRILMMTISKVIFRHGISADGDATMPKFKGN